MHRAEDNRGEERAILVSLLLKDPHHSVERARRSLEELEQLAQTARLNVLASVVQHKDRVDPRWLIGRGKVEELRELVLELEPDTVIFNQELSGMQVRNLEQVLDVKIIDRTQLILDIFAARARTSEGKIQVELAQLNYLLPRLAGHGKNLSRLGGGIGTRGPGETKLETDRRHIHRRIRELERKLVTVVRHRRLQREGRNRSGLYQVALVGYTNAGKSTLLRQLTHSDDAHVEDKLFATLDPMTRRAHLPTGRDILVSDTVGFIQDLPHELVRAFRATLEEVLEADLLVIVVDGSAPDWYEQLMVVRRVLDDLGASQDRRLTVFNKMDLCEEHQRELLATDGPYLCISAFRDEDVERLKQAIDDQLPGEIMSFRLPVTDGESLSMLHRIGEVLKMKHDQEHTFVEVRVDSSQYEKYRSRFLPYEHADGKGRAETEP